MARAILSLRFCVGKSLISCQVLPTPSRDMRSGVKRLNGFRPCHQRPGKWKFSSSPLVKSWMAPASGSRLPVRIFKSVVFPEPLSPRRSATSPWRNSRDTPSKTTCPPKAFWRPSMRKIIFSPAGLGTGSRFVLTSSFSAVTICILFPFYSIRYSPARPCGLKCIIITSSKPYAIRRMLAATASGM